MINLYKTRFHTWTAGGSGGGGGPTMDIKVKVSAGDTTTDYLSNKLVSTDGTATFTILNVGANEQYDVSVGGVTSLTVAAAQALIAGGTVVPNKLYLITDAYGNTAQIFLWGVSTTQFDEQGFGLFTNANTPTPVNVLMKYDVNYDYITEVYQVNSNIRLVQSYDVNGAFSIGNTIDVFPLKSVYNVGMSNSTISDCTLSGNAFLAASFLNIQSSTIVQSSLNVASGGWTCLSTQATDITFLGSSSASGADSLYGCQLYTCDIQLNNGLVSNSLIKGGAVVIASGVSNSVVQNCTILDGADIELLNDSQANNCTFGTNSICHIDASIFNTCNIGNAKTVTPPAGYNATNSSIEDLDSTFEVFINPNIAGVMDMAGYQFGGIVRIGTSGVPASWDLKTINNFPTDHIFCIVPADSNTVDIYDAGAGGTNIYLSTAAVVTYDGDKDDTIVVRSGLNDSTRLFQIGGWQAPSA